MKIIRNILLAIFVVAALAYLNVIIPQPQKVDATVIAYYNSDVCGNLKVLNPTSGGDIKETPSCASGGSGTSHVNSYQTSVTIYNSSNHDITGDFGWDEYWCNYDSGNQCGGSGNPKETTYHRTGGQATIPAHQSKTFTSSNNHPVGNGISYCGVYQHDFTFHYSDGSRSCGPGNPNTGEGFYTMDWGVCRAGTGTDANCHPVQPTATPTPTPAPTATPTPAPVYHDICQNFSCVRVPGPGQNQCRAEEINSPDCSHLTCVNNSCERVPNPGTDTCSPEGSACGPIKHLACVNNACMWVPGPGAPQCTISPDSCRPQQHLGCVNNSCQWIPGPGQAQCTISPDSCAQPHLKVIKIVNNNHGGTKTSSDFMLHVKNASGDVSGSPAAGSTTGTTYTLTAGDYTVSEDSLDGYHQVSISGDCDANGKVTLNSGDNKTCVIQNEDNGGGSCQMPSCNTNISGCSYPYPDTATCSCGPLVCITSTPATNITINNTNTQSQQQQQQQSVLAASVAPAVSATSLPSTGSGAEVLLTLVGLLPVGFKLRKLL